MRLKDGKYMRCELSKFRDVSQLTAYRLLPTAKYVV